MNKKVGVWANILSLIGVAIAISLGIFLFQILVVWAISVSANGSALGDVVFGSLYIYAAVLLIKLVFSILGFKTKNATPQRFLKLGYITIINIVLSLLVVVLSVVYLCAMPSAWFIVIAPIILFATSAALYIVDYVKNKKLASEQGMESELEPKHISTMDEENS